MSYSNIRSSSHSMRISHRMGSGALVHKVPSYITLRRSTREETCPATYLQSELRFNRDCTALNSSRSASTASSPCPGSLPSAAAARRRWSSVHSVHLHTAPITSKDRTRTAIPSGGTGRRESVTNLEKTSTAPDNTLSLHSTESITQQLCYREFECYWDA